MTKKNAAGTMDEAGRETLTFGAANWVAAEPLTIVFVRMSSGWKWSQDGMSFELVRLEPVDDAQRFSLYHAEKVDQPLVAVLHRIEGTWYGDAYGVERSSKDPRVVAAQLVANLY